MLAHVSLDADGGILVAEGTSDDGPGILNIKGSVFVDLDMFNEARDNFSWEGDSDRAAEILLWRLEDHDLMPKVMAEYNRLMRKLCSPGPDGGSFIVDLTVAG